MERNPPPEKPAKKTAHVSKLNVEPEVRADLEKLIAKAAKAGEGQAAVVSAILRFGLKVAHEHGFGKLRGVVYGECEVFIREKSDPSAEPMLNDPPGPLPGRHA